ncbi:glycosyltransferase [Thermodesulfobacteriota bacterium]
MDTCGHNKIPVLFILTSLETGGSERVVFNLCKRLDSRFVPIVAGFRGGAIKKEMLDAGIVVYDLMRRDAIDFSLVGKIIKIIREHNIRIMNSHHLGTLFYAFWASCITRIPIIHTEHSKWESESLPYYWKLVYKIFLKKAAQVIAVSKAAYKHIGQVFHVSHDKLQYIPNGIDINIFKKRHADAATLLSYGIQEGDYVIGSVGNLRSEKNQELIIRAIARIREFGESEKKYKYLCVGGGVCEHQLKQLADELEVASQIHFLGTRADVPYLYRLFDVYCLPSRYEGMPLTILEAMASHVPVIGTNVLGIKELINHLENGILVEDNDPDELAKAIIKMEKNPQLSDSLARTGRQTVVSKYSLLENVKIHEEIFNKYARK